jgi:hypothetical protein
MNDTKYLDLLEGGDSENARLRRLLAERDKMLDELLALLNQITDSVIERMKEQHEHLVFKIKNRTPVD